LALIFVFMSFVNDIDKIIFALCTMLIMITRVSVVNTSTSDRPVISRSIESKHWTKIVSDVAKLCIEDG